MGKAGTELLNGSALGLRCDILGCNEFMVEQLVMPGKPAVLRLCFVCLEAWRKLFSEFMMTSIGVRKARQLVAYYDEEVYTSTDEKFEKDHFKKDKPKDGDTSADG